MTMTEPVPETAPPSPAAPQLTRRLIRGRPDDPAWVRPGLLALLVGTAVLYLAGLGASGWGNAYYAAAAQAGSQSWSAWFFGSFDASNFITVDKTPGALWLTSLSVRIFGLSPWSILVPQAVMGVATVALLYATVRRWYGPAAALIAGLVLATTPVAVLMFRFNNPDALLVLLLVAAAYALVRALENGSAWWLALVGVLLGFGFLTKMLQAFLVLPGFALAYLAAAPPRLLRRLWQLALAGLALVVSAGWYVAVVELLPASARPHVGGSRTNSLLELTLGYNGLGRLFGRPGGPGGGPSGGPPGGPSGGGAGPGAGENGWLRLFEPMQGGQVTWLLPAALLLLVAVLVVTWRAPRTDRIRAGLLLWGSWLLVTGLVFSLMAGIFHAYYVVALAPAIAALCGIGATQLWARRDQVAVSATLAGTVGVTALWGYVLLARTPDWHPWLRWTVLVAGVVVAGLLATGFRLPRRAALVTAGAALLVALTGPAAYALDTAATPHGGPVPSAGPTPAGAPGGGPVRVGPGEYLYGPGGPAPGDGGRGPVAGPPPGGDRGLEASSELVAALRADADRYRWTAAAVGAQQAAGYQLASQTPVMAIGGFSGGDAAPTLERFQEYVAAGEIHYFIASGPGIGPRGARGGPGAGADGGPGTGPRRPDGGPGGPGGRSGPRHGERIADWVAANFTATTIGGVTVYDLSR